MTPESGDARPASGVRSARGVDPGPWVVFWTEQVDLIVRQDWHGLRLRFREDFVFESFLTGLRVSLTGRQAYVDYVRAVTERRVESDVEILDVHGESLCLTYTRIFSQGDENEGPWELTPRVILIRTDEDGLLSLMEVYDAADIDVARTRLEDLAS